MSSGESVSCNINSMSGRDPPQHYRPLLSEDEEFISYDDKDSEQHYFRRKNMRRSKRVCCFLILLIVIVTLVTLLIVVLWDDDESNKSDFPISGTKLGKFRKAAIASDSKVCSDIGKNILRNEGSAVDAAIAILLCYGVVNPVSSGIGGGFFMTVYDSKSGTASVINARESAPLDSTETMYEKIHNSSEYGGLSIAVPGEIKGYMEAWNKWGKLPWKDLFKESIDLAENGFRITKHLAEKMESAEKVLRLDEDTWRHYSNPQTKKMLKEGDMIKFPELAETYKKLAANGGQAFYNVTEGSLGFDILQDLKEKKSIIREEDLTQYNAKIEEPLKVTMKDGSVLYSPRPPASGAVLSFILDILDGYNMTSQSLKTKESRLTAYHRMIEAFKFAYAQRSELGDPAFVPNVTEVVKNLTSREFANQIRRRIWDNTTHGTPYYGPVFDHKLKTSTAHLSVLGNDGIAVSVTTTVNLLFGSGVTGKRTGILFNDEMDDFSSPNITNAFGIPPSPSNFIRPGKRPLSSMCPAVLVDKTKKVKMVVGAAGGSRITTTTAYIAAHVLWFGYNIKEAVDARRLHHQLIPQIVYHEPEFPKFYVDGLIKKHHNVTQEDLGNSIANGIVKDGDWIYANNDFRRPGGSSAGW
ncbi:glutathione hydrolase 1 proenzyme-like isoform X2 [Ostrea edulis]|nr:glutathione hydrolase 1 proenzyme-like isoform X2 [Ostrea edulis]XP_048773751.2 glutathione hydrolase 1 proenzyme-like isoform X2 [Ostrea edulis]XP_056011687.1 glutathione hydrolase 1 proenzyme-like isoform X2 [Ostrea edulis]